MIGSLLCTLVNQISAYFVCTKPSLNYTINYSYQPCMLKFHFKGLIFSLKENLVESQPNYIATTDKK